MSSSLTMCRQSSPNIARTRKTMPRLVSHPDEVKIVTKRFGQGAANIDKYIALGGYEALKKCLAKNICGSEYEFNVITQTGAGAYEVGEESALMESLEGKRGVPRIKPPFPAVVGLYGGPTVINNAETIASVPHVISMGAAAYAAVGTERNGGTRLFGLSGHIERPGVYELPMGYNLKKMIYEVGGGVRGGRKLKAVVPGGSSTPVLLPEEIENLGMDFDQVGKAGSMLGSGGVVVIDDQTCMVEFALRTISFYQHESCGWCIPCREGTDWLKKSRTRLHAGVGVARDIDSNG